MSPPEVCETASQDCERVGGQPQTPALDELGLSMTTGRRLLLCSGGSDRLVVLRRRAWKSSNPASVTPEGDWRSHSSASRRES